MNPQHTLPVAIGGKATLPGGTTIEILGIHNGHVGLIVTEATVPVKPKPHAARRNGGPLIAPPVDDPAYWQEYDERRRKNSARWKRLYKNVGDWVLSNPGAVAGHEIDRTEARARGFDCTGKPMSDGMREAYRRWEERWTKLCEQGAKANHYSA